MVQVILKTLKFFVFLVEVFAMKELVKKYRRDLHRIPEIGHDLYKTHAYVMEHLQKYNCEITKLCKTGIAAFFRSKMKQTPAGVKKYTIALRCDMDALPIKEETNKEYTSIHEGAMHACGHDGHTAILLAVAGELDKSMHEIPHDVLLIFQPAEESIGGAKDICDTGILAAYSVDRIYAYHLWGFMKKNSIGSRPNELMARSSLLNITIHGKSAHCASAEYGIDALAIGCELVCELYKMAETELPKTEYRLLKFGQMSSGTARNVISAMTTLRGTMRCYSDDTFQFLYNRIREIIADFEKKYGCTIDIKQSTVYPALKNDPDLFEEAKSILNEFDFQTFEKPFMLSEDFSAYLQVIPGLMMFLGTGTNIPLHSSNFDFDEEVLVTGVEAYLKLLKNIK